MRPFLVVLGGYVVLVHEAAESGYWAETPDRPGCVSQGNSLEEVLRNMAEAREAVGEGATWTR